MNTPTPIPMSSGLFCEAKFTFPIQKPAQLVPETKKEPTNPAELPRFSIPPLNIGTGNKESATSAAHPLAVRDIVSRRDGVHLATGRYQYLLTVVVSLDPFVLVSLDGEIRWQHTVKPEDFIRSAKSSPASDSLWAVVSKRILA